MSNLTIYPRPKFLGYQVRQIEDLNTHLRVAQILHFTTTRHLVSSLLVVSGKMAELSDILAEIGLKPGQSCLTCQIVDLADRFLLTKWAIFYSIEVLETNTYNSLLFAGLQNRNRGLNSFISGFLVLGSNFEYWRSGPAELTFSLLKDQPDYYCTPKKSFLEKVQC